MRRLWSQALLALTVLVGLLSVWMIQASAAADENALRISLRVPQTCDVDADLGAATPSLTIEWEVTGGVAPYNVFVHGVHRDEPAGSTEALCGIWSSDREVDSGQMPILGRVTDATGTAASALTYTQAVRVIREDPSSNYGGASLRRGETYRIHGLLLTIPAEFDMGLGNYVSHPCDPGAQTCADEFRLTAGGNASGSSIWLRRWHGDEARRSVEPGDYADMTNAAFDRLVASIGKPPRSPLGEAGIEATDSDQLRLELNAPAICETHWGRYGGRRQSIELEWEVRGGRGPYRVQLAGGMHEGRTGTLRMLCDPRQDDTDNNSAVMNVQAMVFDADEEIGSGVVSTYVIPSNRNHAGAFRGGRSYLTSGIRMTIPAALDFDALEIEASTGECSEGTCSHADCLDRGMPVCQSSWTMWTLGGSVSATFGDLTKSIIARSIDADRLTTDEGVRASSVAEVERLLEALDASIGLAPTLPEWGVFNPAPLRIRAWADPVSCGRLPETRDYRYARAQRRVGGGYWWPLGTGDEAWNDDHANVELYCPAELGEHTTTFEVHEAGPSPAMAETTVTHLALPIAGDGVLAVDGDGSRTSYCEPGGARRIYWRIQLGQGPFRVWVNGAEVETHYNPESNWGSGATEVVCADRLGLQVMTLEVEDSSDPPHYTRVPVLLMAVTEHPSGLPWSEFE